MWMANWYINGETVETTAPPVSQTQTSNSLNINTYQNQINLRPSNRKLTVRKKSNLLLAVYKKDDKLTADTGQNELKIR